MKTRRLIRACALIALSVTQGSTVGMGSPQLQEWHTRPDRWKEPRNFQTPFERGYQGSVSVTQQSIEADPGTPKLFSPNKAYWLTSGRSLPVHFTPDNPILVFNERPYLIRIAPAKSDPDYFLKRIDWVNEKLVYIEIWWGKVLGSCYIFDVEKELMVYREMINDGTLPFQQWKQKGKAG